MSVGLQMTIMAFMAFLAGMFFANLIIKYRKVPTQGTYPPTPPPLTPLPPGLFPNLPVPHEVSTGSAVSMVRLFERQNAMETRIKRLEDRL